MIKNDNPNLRAHYGYSVLNWSDIPDELLDPVQDVTDVEFHEKIIGWDDTGEALVLNYETGRLCHASTVLHREERTWEPVVKVCVEFRGLVVRGPEAVTDEFDERVKLRGALSRAVREWTTNTRESSQNPA